MADEAIESYKKALRKIVLISHDGYNEGIATMLQAFGYVRPAWAKITGNRLVVFIGGDGEGDVPDLGQQLKRDFGGEIQSNSNPTDSYYQWAWEAEI